MKYSFSLKSAGSAISKLFAPLFLLSIIISGCNEDPTLLGRDILPPSDDIHTHYYVDSSISSVSSFGKPDPTSLNTIMLLGSRTDTVFGMRKADFMTRFYFFPATIADERTIDSMILRLRVSDYSGDSLSRPMMRIYELTDTLSADTVYYSDETKDNKYDPFVELAHQEINPLDSIIKVVIDNPDFLEKFSLAPDSAFYNLDVFWDLFKGLYITTDDVTEGGNILSIDLSHEDTDLYMYYVDDTTGVKLFDMYVNTATPRVNLYTHDYTGSRATKYTDSPDEQDTLMFISSLSGLDARIQFDEFETWLDSVPVAINNAQLFIPIADSLIYGNYDVNFASELLLYSFDEDNIYDFIYDYRIDPGGYFGGTYSPVDKAFVFNIGLHLQSYINGEITNLNMILLSRNSFSEDARVILKGATAKDGNMELRITYTKF